MANVIVPQYGRSTLADLVPSIGAKLGVAAFTDTLGIPDATHYVVVLVDGLGSNILAKHFDWAPYLSSIPAREITCGTPSTTATSLTCLGTGLPPGIHGMVGYSFRGPDQKIMNGLTFDTGADPVEIQSNPTAFQKMVDCGIGVANVSPARFESSALTLAAHRGACFLPLDSETDYETKIELVRQSVSTAERTFTYVYERFLDSSGHGWGVGSNHWCITLRTIDQFLADLRVALGQSTKIIVTGDHGMVNVPFSHRVIVEDEPSLVRSITDLGGEGRFRQVYTDSPGAVAKNWAKLLGERANVLRREEAIEAGWFGPVSDKVCPRIGDVLVAMNSDWAIMTNQLPGEFNLIGMHGAMTADEMIVPLLIG